MILKLLLNDLHDIYENIKEYNPDRKRKALIVFDDTIAVIVFWSVFINQLKIQIFCKALFQQQYIFEAS